MLGHVATEAGSVVWSKILLVLSGLVPKSVRLWANLKCLSAQRHVSSIMQTKSVSLANHGDSLNLITLRVYGKYKWNGLDNLRCELMSWLFPFVIKCGIILQK